MFGFEYMWELKWNHLFLPLLFFFDLDSSDDRSNTCKAKESDDMQRTPALPLLCYLATKNLTFSDDHTGTRDWHGRGRQSQSWMWTKRLPSGGRGRVCNGWGCLPSLSSSYSDLGCVQEGTLPPAFCLHSQNAAGNFLQGNDRGKLSTARTLWYQTLTNNHLHT